MTNNLRQNLINNGYVPLPAEGKMVLIKGWSRAEVRDNTLWDINGDDLLKKYAHSKMDNTGIRCDGLVAIDIDVSNPDLVDDLAKIVLDTLPGAPLERFRQNSARILLLYRGIGRGKLRTTTYVDDEGKSQCVEILRGNSFQFLAFGKHPSGADIEWVEGASPETVKLDELPFVTESKVSELIEKLDIWLDAEGWEVKSSGGEVGSYEVEHVLTPDMQFSVLDPDALMTCAQLEDTLKGQGPDAYINCHLDGVRPGSDSGAGRAAIGANGRLCISDFVTGKVYFPSDSWVESETIDLSAFREEVYEVREELAFKKKSDGERLSLGEEAADMVFVRAEDKFYYKSNPHITVKEHQFKRDFGKEAFNTFMTQGLNTGHVALRSEYRPDRPQRETWVEGGHVVFNRFWAPDHERVEERGSLGVWHEYMEHLLPDPGDRDIFLDWLANKVQRPWERMFAVVMATPNFGTGRGFLRTIMEKLFGSTNVKAVGMDGLLGRRDGFNGYMSGSLVVCVDEIMASNYTGRNFSAKQKAFESLKDKVDPAPQMLEINIKGVEKFQEMVFCSFLLSTNHMDGLPMLAGDRRFTVLQNGDPMSARLERVLEAWRDDPANISELHGWLKRRKVTRRLNKAIETQAKLDMQEANHTDLDRLLQGFYEWVVVGGWSYTAKRVFQSWLDSELATGEYFVEDSDHRILNMMFDREWSFPPGKPQLRLDGTRMRPVHFRRGKRGSENSYNPDETRQEIREQVETLGVHL